ncbi:hypothetical protein [Geoglobus ahangari]
MRKTYVFEIEQKEDETKVLRIPRKILEEDGISEIVVYDKKGGKSFKVA